jgi:putative inorganic carbon (hco3(-)) transporter
MDRAARLPYLIVSVLTVVALLGTLSRAALLGLPLVPLFFLALRRSGLAGPLAVGALVLTALVASGSSLLPAGIGVADESSGSTVPFAGRLDFWLVALDIWGEHPVLGAGPGSFPQAYAEAPHVGKAYLPDTLVEAPPHAHNLFLHTLAENGLVGLVVLIGLLATAAAVAVRLICRRDHWARLLGAAGLGLLAAFLVQNQLDVTLFEVNTVMFFSLLGLLKAAANLPKDDHALLR